MAASGNVMLEIAAALCCSYSLRWPIVSLGMLSTRWLSGVKVQLNVPDG